MTTISIRISEPGALRSNRAITTAAPSWLTRLSRWLQSTWCVINGGHYKVLHTEPERLALRCVACGHTSPGWQVGSTRAAARIPAPAQQVRRVRRPAAA